MYGMIAGNLFHKMYLKNAIVALVKRACSTFWQVVQLHEGEFKSMPTFV